MTTTTSRPALVQPAHRAEQSLFVQADATPSVTPCLFASSHAAIRIAVLDDDRDTAESTAAALSLRHGLVAQAFVDAAHLQNRLAEFDAFVLDWVLGDDMTSEPLVRLIRASTSFRQPPIVVLSGQCNPHGKPIGEDIISTVRNFNVAFRAKPCSIAVLAADISDAFYTPTLISRVG